MDIKNTFDSLKDRAVDLAQAGMAQSKRLAEIARLKMDNMSQQDAIKKAYVELGKLYYAERGAAPEAAYISGCEKITAAKAAIETNNARIAELKTQEDDEPEVVHTVVVETEETVQQPEAESAPQEGEAEQPSQPEKKDDDGIHLTL